MSFPPFTTPPLAEWVIVLGTFFPFFPSRIVAVKVFDGMKSPLPPSFPPFLSLGDSRACLFSLTPFVPLVRHQHWSPYMSPGDPPPPPLPSLVLAKSSSRPFFEFFFLRERDDPRTLPPFFLSFLPFPPFHPCYEGGLFSPNVFFLFLR